MDRECRSELAFRLLTDSRVQRAPASTQLALSGRWTGRWLRRQVQSHSVQVRQFYGDWSFYLPPIPIFYFHHTVTKPLSAVTRNGKMVMVICKVYDYWIIRSETTSTVSTNKKATGSSLLFQSCRKDSPLICQRILLAAKEFPYDFLPFAVETRDTFYWDPDCLTSVFLALYCLKVVTFVWGIEWVMRRKKAQSALSLQAAISPMLLLSK